MEETRALPKRKRALIAVLAVGAASALLPAPAGAHVHGITPLRCVGVAEDGAHRTDSVPAAEKSRLPFEGLIPSSVGKSSLEVGDGGFDTPACPAP
jgi:hypothetical protein